MTNNIVQRKPPDCHDLDILAKTIYGEWRNIPGILNYEVSEYGHVRRTMSGKNTWVGRILKTKWHVYGYPRYDLTINGKNKGYEAHTLVAMAFIGARPSPQYEVAHNDGDVKNCHYTNLRWATHLDNESDKKKHGTSPCGERNPRSKLTEPDIIAIRREYKLVNSLTKVAKKHNVAFQTISKIVNGKSWAHVQ